MCFTFLLLGLQQLVCLASASWHSSLYLEYFLLSSESIYISSTLSFFHFSSSLLHTSPNLLPEELVPSWWPLLSPLHSHICTALCNIKWPSASHSCPEREEKEIVCPIIIPVFADDTASLAHNWWSQESYPGLLMDNMEKVCVCVCVRARARVCAYMHRVDMIMYVA